MTRPGLLRQSPRPGLIAALNFSNFFDGATVHGSLAWGVLLLVTDRYEHTYAMDCRANARRYIEGFFQDISWDDVNRGAETARRS